MGHKPHIYRRTATSAVIVKIKRAALRIVNYDWRNNALDAAQKKSKKNGAGDLAIIYG